MEVKRTWKRAMAFMLALVMAFTFVPNVPALAVDINPATDEWVDYRGTDSIPVNHPLTSSNNVTVTYGDTAEYYQVRNEDDDGTLELYFIVNGVARDRNNRSTANVTVGGVRFYADQTSDNLTTHITITNAWNAAPGTYSWELYEQDDNDGPNKDSSDDRIEGGTFTILPRPATLTVWPIDMVYGENGKVIQYKYTIDGLVPGDKPEDVISNVWSRDEGTATAQSLKDDHTATMIKHAQGEIAEYDHGSKYSCYTLTVPTTPAKFNIRHVNLQDLTVSFGNKNSKVYDGLNGEDFSRNPKFTYNNIPLTLEEGIDYNLAWKKAGTNTTYRAPNIAGNYTAVITAPSNQTNTINEHTGFIFTVEKKPITIVPKDQSFTFDGTTKAKTKPADCVEGYSEVLSGGKDGDTYKAVGLAETDNMTGFALTIGDNSDDDLMLSTWVVDANDADGDKDKTDKIEASKDITLDKDSIKIIRTAESTGASTDPSLVNIPTGADVTDCYDITIASEPGKLTIAPKVKTESATDVDEQTEYFAEIEDVTVTYDGNKKSLGDVFYKNADETAQFVANANNLTVEYKYGDGEWTTKKPSFTDAGTYEIEYRIAHGADYNNGYPNEDERCYDLLFAETTGTATLTIKGKPQDDATVSVENKKWTYGDGIKDVITVKDKDGTDITKKTDFTGNKTITYRYIVDPNPSIDEISDDLKNNTADWKELNLSDSCNIPTGTYWLEATIPAYDNYAETKVYTQFTVGKKNIKVGLNRFNLTYADNYSSAEFNNTSYVTNDKKYTYEGIVGNDDPLDKLVDPNDSEKYSDVELITDDQTGETKIRFANDFSGEDDIFGNYIITVADEIVVGEKTVTTDGLVTYAPVDIADMVKQEEGGSWTGYVEYAYKAPGPSYVPSDEGIYFEWTGEPVGPEVDKLYLRQTINGSTTDPYQKVEISAEDYTCTYFKLDSKGLMSVQPLEGLPKDKGDYVLVVKGKNVKPGSSGTADKADAWVYGQKELKFSITDRIIMLDVSAIGRTYEYGNANVSLDFSHAKIYGYNNESGLYNAEITGDLKAAILGDTNVKAITAEMADDKAGTEKTVTVNGNKQEVELATTTPNYDNYKVILSCYNKDTKKCETTVDIAKANLANTETNPTALTIGERYSASWQYGDYDATKAKLALTQGVQSKTVDGKEQKDTSNDNVIITYYYSKAPLDADDFADVSIDSEYIIGTSLEAVENWLKTQTTGKYQIVAVISEGTNYNTITTAPIKITVNKRNITITAKEQYRYYMDNKVPNLDESSSDYTVTHVKDDKTVVTDKIFAAEGETLATVITGVPSCDDVTAERTQDVGEFDIVKGELKVADEYASNYELTFVPDKFKILPLPLDNVYDEEYPQIAESKGFKVEVRLEKDTYVCDGTEKSPSFTVVYTRTVGGVNESYTIPQEQYLYYYTKDNEDKQSSHKLPGKYNVYVYRANGKDNVKEDTVARGLFEITKVPVTVKITMNGEGRVYDGTTDIKNVSYTTTLLYKTNEDEPYKDIPDTGDLKELQDKFVSGENGDADYKKKLEALVLPSADAGTYKLGTGKNNISVADLDAYFKEKIDNDAYEYCSEDAIYEGEYIVNKLSLNNVDFQDMEFKVEDVVYNGKYQTPKVTVAYKNENGENLIKESDYIVTYRNNKNVTDAATARIKATPKGNFTYENTLTDNAIEIPFKITPMPITVKSSFALKDKTYDGNAMMTLVGDYEAGDFIEDEDAELVFTDANGETLKLDGTDKIVILDKNAGDKSGVIIASIVGEDKDNYKVVVEYADKAGNLSDVQPESGTPITVKGKILPKEITVQSTLSLTDKVYDGNAKMTVNGAATLKGIIGDDVVTLSGADAKTVNVSNTSAGDKTYTFNLSLTGADKGNYTIKNNTVTAKGKITKKDVTVTSTLKLTDKTYDANATMAVTGSATANGLVAGDGTKLSGAEAKTVTVASAEVGDKTYTFNLSLTGDTAKNYNLKTTSITASGKIDPIKTVDMYRLYNPNSGEHFYTASAAEKDNLVAVGWNYEGIGWKAPVKSNTPVYRLYNPNAGDHHYTVSAGERDMLIALGWKDEGIGWYSDDTQGVALYRQYNPNAKAGNHNYTANKSENDWLVSLGWRGEGIGWYGVK